jgi:predicted signal transduction protein with EAL and GGDEF domain
MYAKLTEVATQGCLDSIDLLSFKPLHANLGRRGEGNVMAEILAMRRSEPEGPVIAEQSGGILRLVLANPPANALSIATMTALQAELDSAREDKSVRVVVLAAIGKVFSGGHDLKEK